MPTLIAAASATGAAPRPAAGVVSTPCTSLEAHHAVLAAARAAREAANLVYRSAACRLHANRLGVVRDVRRLDLRLDQTRAMFERMTGLLSPAQSVLVGREVDLARDSIGKAFVAQTTLRAESANPVPRSLGVRFLSAQVYSALAQLQGMVEGIHRKLSFLPATTILRSPGP